MHIIKLEAENIKRLHAVKIAPNGSLVQITGPNGAGKSSVLDAITYALGGKSMQPAKPLRRGTKHARVVINLGDKTLVRRVWDADGSSRLTVESKEGARFSSPQKLLDELVGELTFDPLAFSVMSAKDQAATLKRVAGLDFDHLDGKRVSLFEKRAEVNRDLKALKAQRDAIAEAEAEAPDEEVSVAVLSEQLTESLQDQSHNEQCRLEAERGLQDYESAECDLRQAERDLESAKQAATDAAENVRVRNKAIDKLVDPNIAGIKQQIANAEGINRRVREQKQRHALTTQVTATEADAAKLSAQIDAIDTDKAQQLADASLPVEGLGVGDDGVTLNKLPFEQASSAEQLRVSIAMGIAINPKLRIMLIRDGSLLDPDNLALVAKMADEHDVQVWLERVADSEGVGVYIEDGYASGAEALPVETI